MKYTLSEIRRNYNRSIALQNLILTADKTTIEKCGNMLNDTWFDKAANVLWKHIESQLTMCDDWNKLKSAQKDNIKYTTLRTLNANLNYTEHKNFDKFSVLKFIDDSIEKENLHLCELSNISMSHSIFVHYDILPHLALTIHEMSNHSFDVHEWARKMLGTNEETRYPDIITDLSILPRINTLCDSAKGDVALFDGNGAINALFYLIDNDNITTIDFVTNNVGNQRFVQYMFKSKYPGTGKVNIKSIDSLKLAHDRVHAGYDYILIPECNKFESVTQNVIVTYKLVEACRSLKKSKCLITMTNDMIVKYLYPTALRELSVAFTNGDTSVKTDVRNPLLKELFDVMVADMVGEDNHIKPGYDETALLQKSVLLELAVKAVTHIPDSYCYSTIEKDDIKDTTNYDAICSEFIKSFTQQYLCA